ncbi:MAG TPA: RHS repeat-associated core domain-containing protein [Syntrophobacteraceae bacterium]|nr:RHS repeat-associated core domain-containing protein [Syntrophobacteraceae bacterium]
MHHFYHNDHLGTPMKLTAPEGALSWSARYAPFGLAFPDPASPVPNPLRLPGQYFDPETGLHYNLHRYYDPNTGRNLTRDPIGLEGGMNPYGYAENVPVNLVDPWGLWA